jgi:hypothetical protein
MEGNMLLFDLEKDPKESVDLSLKYPQIKENLMKKYNAFLKSLEK